MDDADIVIVGGGFAGLACAQSAARKGLKTVVVERKTEIGASPHTTGLLVKEVADRWNIPAALTRPVSGVRIYSPSLRWMDLASPGYFFLATDTPGLLRWLAGRAENAGARLILGRSFRGVISTSDGLELTDLNIRGRFLIGADGARSQTAQILGLSQNREFLVGVEDEYEGLRDLPEDQLHCFLDSALAPGYIGWVVPGVGVAQVGLACRWPIRPRLDLFVERLRKVFNFDGARVINRRGGLIPIGGPLPSIAAERALLIGDSAGYVSPLTAGGIHTALHFGWQAGAAVALHLQKGGPHPESALAPAASRFFWKGILRRVMDVNPPNWLLNFVLTSPPFRRLAQRVFFHYHAFSSADPSGR